MGTQGTWEAGRKERRRMMLTNLDPISEAFCRAKIDFEKRLACREDLESYVGFYGDCPVLKLQKKSWRNEPSDVGPNSSGVFFSIWPNQSTSEANQLFYNIHALKMRGLNGYRISSRDFAEDFRREFITMTNEWPNVRTQYGPQTLMQGWIEIDAQEDHLPIVDLMVRFQEIAPVIDQLLDQRKYPVRSA